MKKKRFLFRRLILMATALLMVNLCLSAVGESYSANVMRLLNYEGDVHILDADGSNRFIMENARFYSGESLITSEGAMASVGLDATKVLTLDSMTQVTFLKENNHMTLTLSSGRLLLDVQQKLDENESFDIQTSNMTVGIRGTITYLTSFDGSAEEINQLLLKSNQNFRELLQREMPDGYSGNFSQLVVLEGTAVATFKNEQGQLQSVEVHAGEKITMLDGSREAAVVPAARSDLGNDMVSFIRGDPALSERVEKASDILDDETKAKLAGQAGLHIHQFYVDSSSVPPTCSMDGYTKYICDCGKSFVTNETALGHDFGEWETVAEPDCTHEGKRQRVCTRCEETEQETIPAKGHTPVTEPAIAATCTASGLTEHIYCDVCGEMLEPYQEKIPALSHNWGEWVTVTEPDCTHEGKRQRVCTRCEETEQETIPAKGHTPVTEPAIAATCTASGWTEHIYCSVCKEVLEPYQEEIPALGHNWGEWVTVTGPDCNHGGKRLRVCARCEITEQEAIPAKEGHTPVTDPAIAATCTASGWTEHIYCAVCMKVLEPYQDKIPALGHDWGEWETVTEPDCTHEGKRQRVCGRCEETEQETIPAKGHTPVTDPAIAATCTASGWTEHIYCAVCKEVLEPCKEEIPALGHNWGEWETVAEPDCTHEGKRQRVCTRCEETEQETIPAKGHTPVTEPAIAATCTASGWTEHIYCSVCEEVLEPYQEKVPALGHNWGEWVTVTEPDCTHEGKRQRVCARCEITEQETIPAKGHTPVTDPAIDATCTASGWTEHIYCAVCEEVLEPYQEEIPALGHNWGEWVTVTEPDCTHEGKRQRVCARCEETEQEALTALGHNWGEWVTVTEPDCTHEGKRQHVCARCEETEQETIPAKEHTPVTDPAIAATCTASGWTEYIYCSVCEEVLEPYQEEIPALGHEWGEWTVVKEATENEDGSEQRTCFREGCGATETRVIPSFGSSSGT